MGSIHSKEKNTPPSNKEVKILREKVRILQREINEIMSMRESESHSYEQEIVVSSFKEAEWKRERKRMKEEVKKLRERSEEKEEKMKGMEEEREKRERDLGEWQLLGLVEEMRVERIMREEAVEKWKRLYLAIKVELDDLIERTHQGERLYWRTEEEDLVMEMQSELREKEDTIEILQARLASMEQEESKRKIQIDILKQSLKIMSHKKKLTCIVAKQPLNNI